MRRNSDDMVGPVMQASSVVKFLSRRWWIPTGARLEGPKLETEGSRADVGSRPPTRSFRAFRALCLAFMTFK